MTVAAFACAHACKDASSATGVGHVHGLGCEGESERFAAERSHVMKRVSVLIVVVLSAMAFSVSPAAAEEEPPPPEVCLSPESATVPGVTGTANDDVIYG